MFSNICLEISIDSVFEETHSMTKGYIIGIVDDHIYFELCDHPVFIYLKYYAKGVIIDRIE